MGTPLIAWDAWDCVFDEWRGARARLCRAFGNPGDRIIEEAVRQIFVRYGILEVSSRADVVFWNGGGNMGEMYPDAVRRRGEAAAMAAARGVPLIVLPQSWNGIDPGCHDFAWARERGSLKWDPFAGLAPDLALGYVRDYPVGAPVHGEGYFWRGDAEGTGRRGGNGDPSRGVKGARDYVLRAARWGRIHTDRLHFAVAGMIAGREVVLYDNSYGKNRAVWEYSLRDLGCAWGEF